MSKPHLLKVIFVLLIHNTILSQSNCSSFDPQFFVLNGNAQIISDNEVRLTEDRGNSLGTIWSSAKILFDENFTIEGELYFGVKDGGGADGIAFVMQPLSSNQGQLGGGIGYTTISPSLAFEFDTYLNAQDPMATDHIALIKNGAGNNLEAHSEFTEPVNLNNIEDGKWHAVTIEYTADSNSLKLFFDGNLLIDVVVDLRTIFPGEDSIFWGFTASTGGLNNVQSIRINRYCALPEDCDVAPPEGDSIQSFCGATTINDLVVEGYNLQWYDSETEGQLIDYNTLLTDGQVIYASQTINGCESTERLRVELNITSFPITISNNQICPGDQVELSVTAGETEQYLDEYIDNLETHEFNNTTIFGPFFTEDVIISPDINFPQSGTLNFDLYIHDSWDGTPDALRIYFDDIEVFNYSFQNHLGASGQTYPDGQNNLATTGASTNSLPRLYTSCPTGSSSHRTSLYHISIPFNSPFNTIKLKANLDGSSFCNTVEDESYSIDNLSFTTNASVLWSTGETTESIIVQPLESTLYWVDIITNGNTCREYITVEAFPAPNKPNGASPQVFCKSNTPTIESLYLDTPYINWYSDAVGGSPLTVSTPLESSMTLYAGAFNPTSFCENPDRFPVEIILEDPVLPDIESIQCFKLGNTINSLTPEGYSINWYTNETADQYLPLDYEPKYGDILYGAAVNPETGCESSTRIKVVVKISELKGEYQ